MLCIKCFGIVRINYGIISEKKIGYQVFSLILLSCLLGLHIIWFPVLLIFSFSFQICRLLFILPSGTSKHKTMHEYCIYFISIIIRLLKNANIQLNNQRENHVAPFQYINMQTWILISDQAPKWKKLLQIITNAKKKCLLMRSWITIHVQADKMQQLLKQPLFMTADGHLGTWTHQGLDGLQ